MSTTMDPDARTRARLERHWKASDGGDIVTEHAIYAADAILDYPQWRAALAEPIPDGGR